MLWQEIKLPQNGCHVKLRSASKVWLYFEAGARIWLCCMPQKFLREDFCGYLFSLLILKYYGYEGQGVKMTPVVSTCTCLLQLLQLPSLKPGQEPQLWGQGDRYRRIISVKDPLYFGKIQKWSLDLVTDWYHKQLPLRLIWMSNTPQYFFLI